jgi:hypothetical protein
MPTLLHSVALVFATTTLTTATLGAEFFVSPAGGDTNSGSQAAPFASFARAQAAARAARKAEPDAGVAVNFASGVYTLGQPLQFTPLDSGDSVAKPVIYRAEPDAEVIISGGQLITGWQPDPHRSHLWRTRVTNPAAHTNQLWRFEQLWINGQRAIRARTPDWMDFSTLEGVTEKSTGVAGPPMQHTFTVPPGMLSALRGLSTVELQDVQIVVIHNWDTTREWLQAVSPTNETLTTRGFKMKPWNKLKRGCLFYLENYLAALDAPGEWYLDRDGWLYYWPRLDEDMATAKAIAPVLDQFLSVQGQPQSPVQHLRFEGLQFRYSACRIPAEGFAPSQAAMNLAATAVQLDGASDIQFTNCAVEHIGSTALWFRHDCHDCGVEHSRLLDLGVSGVRIGETKIVPGDVRTARIVVDNCIVQSGGRLRPDAPAVWVGQTGDNTISHCDIGDFFYTGISAGWTWGYGENAAKRNRIEYNHIHHLGYRMLSDMGGVYTLGPSEGTVVRNNVIHDVYGGGYGGWGLYLDEGSSDILCENNLVYNVLDGGLHEHFGKDNVFRNNIFAYSDEGQIAITKSEPHVSFSFEHNLVYWNEGELLGYGGWKNGATVILSSNLYWRAQGQPIDFAGKTWAQWQAKGNDRGSIIADPLFVDAARRDFRLQPDSPAGKIGFRPFDASEAGLYGDDSWKALAAKNNFPEPFVAPTPKPLELEENFEGTKPLPFLDLAELHEGDHQDLITIAEDPSGDGNHCLRIQGSTNLESAFEPYFALDPQYVAGHAHLAFSIWLGPGAQAQCEWRSHGSRAIGPSVAFKQGAALVRDRRLLDVPTNQWVRVEMDSELGRRDNVWNLSVQVSHRERREFKGLPCDPLWNEVRWLGFSSHLTNQTVFYLDDIEMKNH